MKPRRLDTSKTEIGSAYAQHVTVTDEALVVDLVDGRCWRLIGRGEGIHWPELDEDISVANLLAGLASGESQGSLKRWLAARGEAV